jgi:hypothetical protein
MKALITRENGESLEVEEVPLTLEEAQLLRDYDAWINRYGYDAELICADCGEDFERNIGRDIGLICHCRMLWWKAS